MTVSLSRDISSLQPAPPAVRQTQLPDPVPVVFLRVGAHLQPHHRREDQQVSGHCLSLVSSFPSQTLCSRDCCFVFASFCWFQCLNVYRVVSKWVMFRFISMFVQ